jgi:hypothetical protein
MEALMGLSGACYADWLVGVFTSSACVNMWRFSMTMLATRMRELADLEGFDIQVLDANGAVVDPTRNGLPRFDFDRKAKGSMTVTEWKDGRFKPTYAGYDCRVLNGDGTEAHGNTKLESVRATYEEP